MSPKGDPTPPIWSASVDPWSIAVVIPAYNAEAYLPTCLESVWAQTHSPAEIIVVDDGSTDGTPELLRSAGDRIRTLRTPNRGLAAARNAGFSLAQARFVALLDADDYWPRGKLAVYLEHVRRYPNAGLYYSDYYCVGPMGIYRRGRAESPNKDPFRHMLSVNFIASSTAMIERVLWKEVGGLRGGFLHPSGVTDWDFFLRLVRFKACHYIPEPLMYYRVHHDSAMHNRLEALWKDSVRLVYRHTVNLPNRQFLRREALASTFYQSAVRFMAGGNSKKARAHCQASLARSFFSGRTLLLWILSLAGPKVISRLLVLRRQIWRRLSFFSKGSPIGGK